MSTNLLIGVGGTGAKVVESALFCFLAGLGPSAVTVGFVDQDEANGNVKRSRVLLESLQEFRRVWGGGRSHSLDWSRDREHGGAGLGSVAVKAMSPSLWCPHTEQGTTLAGMFGAEVLESEDPKLKALMDFLYMPDESELYMDLGVGYRGRPHIGAAAMLARLGEADNSFARGLQEVLNQARAGQEVRIFLIGSVFGGTGAAGFPNLARALRRAARGPNNQGGDNVKIGGALMLPYFGFSAPKDRDDNVARTEDLLRNSRAALKYYHRLFQQEAVFDEFYLAGWGPNFQLGYHSPGSASQANPPLPPELLGALGAVRFFDEGRRVGGEALNPTYICSRAEPDALTWDDLPKVSRERASEPFEKLGQLLRFCVAWRDTYRPTFDTKYSVFKAPPGKWWKGLGLNSVRFDQQDTKDNLKSIDDLVARTLVWAATMQGFATTSDLGRPAIRRFELWDLEPLVERFEPHIDPEKPGEPVTLRPPGSPQGATNYARVIRPPTAAAAPRDQGELNEELNSAEPGGGQGVGALIAAIHHGARLSAAPTAQ